VQVSIWHDWLAYKIYSLCINCHHNLLLKFRPSSDHLIRYWLIFFLFDKEVYKLSESESPEGIPFLLLANPWLVSAINFRSLRTYKLALIFYFLLRNPGLHDPLRQRIKLGVSLLGYKFNAEHDELNIFSKFRTTFARRRSTSISTCGYAISFRIVLAMVVQCTRPEHVWHAEFEFPYCHVWRLVTYNFLWDATPRAHTVTFQNVVCIVLPSEYSDLCL